MLLAVRGGSDPNLKLNPIPVPLDYLYYNNKKEGGDSQKPLIQGESPESRNTKLDSLCQIGEGSTNLSELNLNMKKKNMAKPTLGQAASM